jgi:hypothetical protein
MKNSPSRILGWLALSIGMDILIGIVFYELSFQVYNRTPLLTIGTFLIVIGALLNPALILIFHHDFHGESLGLRQFIALVGMIGSVVVLIGSGFDFLNTIVGHNLIILYSLSQTQSIIAVGYGFMGIWLLLLNVQALFHDAWSRHLAWFGTIAGIIMAIGLFAIPKVFIPYVSLYHELVPELGELVGDLGWRLFYPAWSIWFGRVILKGQYGGQHLQSFVL